MRLDRLDVVIIFLPILGMFDVLSTFLAAWQGYPTEQYETGLLASFFAQRGVIHLYVLIYVGILMAMSAVLLCIKYDLLIGRFLDKVVFLLLTVVVCIIEAIMMSVVVSNLLIGWGGYLAEVPRWLIYISLPVTILTFIRNEVEAMLGLATHGKH